MTTHILIIGNPIDGLQVIGPFLDASTASEFADANIEDTYWMSEMKNSLEAIEWDGHPDPRDPDNFWIDDKTGSRVNALTGEWTKTTFAGFHKFRADDGSEYGSFEVFEATHSHDTLEPGWYWWKCNSGELPQSDSFGPFPTSEGAYLDAIGD